MASLMRQVRRSTEPTRDTLRFGYRYTWDESRMALGLCLSPWVAELVAASITPASLVVSGTRPTQRMADTLDISDFTHPAWPDPYSWGFGKNARFNNYLGDNPTFLFHVAGHRADPRESERTARAILATLSLLGRTLDGCHPRAGPEDLPQSMLVSTSVSRHPRGFGYNASLDARLTAPHHPWVARLAGEARRDVKVAMITAGKALGIPRRFGQYECSVCDGRWVHLQIPGHSVGLDPDYGSYSPGSGYRLVPHNVRSATQALTLLVGLAAITDLYHEEFSDE